MSQKRFTLPGHYLTVRLNNPTLARWLLEREIAVPPDTMGKRYACWAGERGAMEIRVGWDEMREMEGFGLTEALLELTPADQQESLREALASEAVMADYHGNLSREIYVELPNGTGFATTWFDGENLVKFERCDDDGEILALVEREHLRELRWEKIPPIARVIDSGAAVNCDELREIDLTGIRQVAKNAFQRCANLERVVLGPDLREIHQGSFDRCTNLWQVDTAGNPDLDWVTPDFLRGGGQGGQAGDWLYEQGEDGLILTGSHREEYNTMSIPEELDGQPVVELAEEAFRDKLFQKVVLPRSLKRAGDGSLYSPILRQAELYGEVEPDVTGPFASDEGGCKLQKVTILPGTRRIADCLFEDLFAIQEVRLPDTLEEIGAQAFSGCGSLKEIHFPEGLKRVEDSAFWDCDALEEISLPAGLEYLGSDAFGDCDDLRRVTLPRSCEVAEDAFEGCPEELEIRYLDETPDAPRTEETAVPAAVDATCEETVLERLLRYVAVCTTSREGAERCPSTEGQRTLACMLAEELKGLGVADAVVDSFGYVYGHLPATPGLESAPALGLIAHMDTAAFRGENVRPQVIPDYDGGDVPLGESGKTLRVSDFPHLAELKGRTLVTTDGSTLLGGDDKAGIAEIMTLLAGLAGAPHGRLCVAFTPDEEIGAGAERFDLAAFGADFAYTVDGGPEGEIQYENFNACSAEVVVHGFDVHPGEGKNTMRNAALVAMELNGMLPTGQTPRDTEGYEGFYHLDQMSGNVERAQLRYIVRDHSAGAFRARKDTLIHAVKLLNEKYGPGTVELTLRDQYENMAEIIRQHPHLIERAKLAAEQVGLTPRVEPIRGGTDGARLSFMGLPCPNLGTGGYAFHGPYEHITVQGMERVTAMLRALVEAYTRPV